MTDIIVLIGMLIAAVLGVLGYGEVRKREGREEADHDARKEADARLEEGRARRRDHADDKPDDRVRRNNDLW